MKLLRKLLLFLLFFILVSLFLYPDNDNKKICILYSPSSYKEKIITKLEEALDQTNTIITKDTFINIKNYDPDDFDVILLLSGIAMFNPYPQAISYIKQNNYASNIIYFCAAYLKKAVYGILDKNKIDAITAASEDNNIDETVKLILEAVYKITLEIKN